MKKIIALESLSLLRIVHILRQQPRWRGFGKADGGGGRLGFADFRKNT